MTLGRRAFLRLTAAALAVGPVPLHAQSTAPASLLEAARRLAGADYVAPSGELPPPFAGLDYNAYRGIRPIAGKAAMLPQGDAFAVDLLPPGLYFPDPVTVERQVDGGWTDVALVPALFDFQDRYFDTIPESAPGAGFSGLRIRHPLNTPGVMDEVAVFQGASYFRAIGRSMVYGLSARSVALGTGGAAPEEFPRFTHLRVHEGTADAIRIEGVIDGPSLAAHIDILTMPGTDTVMDVSLTVFPRRDIADIGIAPLTSMYLKGPMHAAVSDDFRPRVHDSNVLYIENGAGERLWRPIGNPARVETSAFADTGPRQFGLYQTTRAYEDFEDTEARYQDRPSATVSPTGDWGDGAVMLVEIPTGTEFLDNIVAFWRPKDPLLAGGMYRYRYRINWTTSAPTGMARRILQSRSGREHDRPGSRRYVIDFDGNPDDLVADLSVLVAPPDAVFGKSVFALPDNRGTRVTFLLTPAEAQSLELRLVLRKPDGSPESPVWLHRWTRKRDGGV